MSEGLGAEPNGALDSAGIRVEQQFVLVVPEPEIGRPRTACAKRIALSCAEAFHEAPPPAVRAFGKRYAAFALPGDVARLEETEVDAVRVAGVHGHIGAPVPKGHPGQGREVTG